MFKLMLFRWLFPKHDAAEDLEELRRDAAEDLEELRREYERKCSTLQRSPLDESVWVRKFVALDEDYRALEKETQGLYADNFYLKRRVKELEK